MNSGLLAYRRFITFLLKSPRRAFALIPAVLVSAFMIGFGFSSVAFPESGPSGKVGVVPPQVALHLLSLVPAAYAAATAPLPCASTCNALDPNSYSTTSDFYAANAAGVDFPFILQGDSNVGYINVNSPRKSVTKRFDQ
ncbi:MAG TPA: hypothetical protein VF272_03950 [Candidatus Saccharimonadia bacterium]